MRALIANKLTYIWSEVKRLLEKEDIREELFKDTLWLQRIFLLKNYPAYLHEYYLLYKEMISEEFIKEPFSITSFKNGCGIDYDAFYVITEEIGVQSYTYSAIEPQLWQDQNGAPHKSLTWVWSDLVDLAELNMNRDNLLLFPKSLKKLSYQEVNALRRFIQIGTFERDFLCVAFSADDVNDPRFENNIFESIIQTFVKWQKYEVVKEKIIEATNLIPTDVEDRRFEYPRRLFKYLNSHPITKQWLPETSIKRTYSRIVFLKRDK